MRITLAPMLFLLLLVAAPLAAQAEGWDMALPEAPEVPPYFIAVGKANQTFYEIGHKSPLAVLNQYNCTTGQVAGDKLVRGDKRTPEGVYFVTHKRTTNLDYELYGNLAFPLNYPNPVDKARGKTGSGIWVHGRGRPIVPMNTKGCVALNNNDIGTLEASLVRGTPVIIADTFALSSEDDQTKADAALLKQRVHDWAAAWSGKSTTFLDFYNPERFTKAHSSFDRFAAKKARLFTQQPWIQVQVADVRALPGPDYWVTWFAQRYRTKSMDSVLTKRLYWQQDENGVWRITGKETTTAAPGMKELFDSQDREAVLKRVVDWKKAWMAADIDRYMDFYTSYATQGGRRGTDAIREHKNEIWPDKKPQELDITRLKITKSFEGMRVSFIQDYASVSGYADRGRKTLILEPHGGDWYIAKEEWAAL